MTAGLSKEERIKAISDAAAKLGIDIGTKIKKNGIATKAKQFDKLDKVIDAIDQMLYDFGLIIRELDASIKITRAALMEALQEKDTPKPNITQFPEKAYPQIDDDATCEKCGSPLAQHEDGLAYCDHCGKLMCPKCFGSGNTGNICDDCIVLADDVD
jgi:hypothetical protein